MGLRVFRVKIGAEGVEDPLHPGLHPLIQHVVYAVARRKADVLPMLMKHKELQLTEIPEILDELPTDLPLWPCKIPPDSPEYVYTVVASRTAKGVERALRERFLDRTAILAMIDAKLWRRAPHPIDTSKPGVW